MPGTIKGIVAREDLERIVVFCLPETASARPTGMRPPLDCIGK